MDKVSYALGLGIARQLSGLGATEINVEDFAQALKDIFSGKEPQISDEEGQSLVSAYLQQKQDMVTSKMKEEGQKFLEENSKKEGIYTV
jgi:FKBP-type peptidyl-prolyl cis-trans isomerase FklB